MQSKVIGLTGASGAGKSTAAAILARLGAVVLDCDKLAHENMQAGKPCFDEIVTAFGNDILDNGEINRKKLGAIVFSDSAKLGILMGITNGYLRRSVRERIAAADGVVIIDAAILFEAELNALCNATIGIFADDDIRLARIIARDKIDEDAARRRINSQTAQSLIKAKVDYAVQNDGGLSELESELTWTFQQIIT